MDFRINPFHELYVTETISPDRFVNLFSPYLVQHSTAMFQAGNVIIKGVKGSGKSMLLRLLSPETRIAYAKTSHDFPIPPNFRNFISAGINLTRCGILDFGQRPMSTSKEDDKLTLPLFFGDFLNYWIVLDLLVTIEKYTHNDNSVIGKELGLNAESDRLKEFTKLLSADDCWFSYHNNTDDLESFKKSLVNKIYTYRSFLNFNIQELPKNVVESKSAIGVPIAKTVRFLRQAGILPENANVFIKIDQYEELSRLKGLRGSTGSDYRQIINKALGLREPQVFYRIGTRRYAWKDDLCIYGTDSSLEENRDYKTIDLDEMLRRKENARTWIFPGLAEDVFKRRLSLVDISFSPDEQGLKTIFGTGLSSDELAKEYAGSSPHRLLALEKDWPNKWIKFLQKLSEVDPLSSRLGEAWARQQGKEEIMNSKISRPFPWEENKYWMKERIEHSLMHIAGRCSQRLIWAGMNDILALSGGNILIFLSICQHIWSAWIRSKKTASEDEQFQKEIPTPVQSIGIHEASMHWLDTIATEPGGASRQRFINHLGTYFYKTLYNDKSLSYPGHNGFSLKVSELSKMPVIKRFLDDSVDYGDLYDAPHTTKSKDHEKRRKWYLKPILSPNFRIPVVHTKEPIYLNTNTLIEWLVRCEGIDPKDVPAKNTSKATVENEFQGTLFNCEPEDV